MCVEQRAMELAKLNASQSMPLLTGKHRFLHVEIARKSFSYLLLWIMAFPVVEFSRQGYKIRKVFG